MTFFSSPRGSQPHSWTHFLLVVAAMVTILGFGQKARAQMTVEVLLRSTVEDPIASKFNEISAAITAFEQNDFSGARDLLVNAVEKSEQLAPADVMMAQLYGSINQVNALRSSLENSVKSYPDDPEAYIVFGDVARSQGRFTEAGLCYDKAISLCDKYSRNVFRKTNLQSRANGGAAIVAEAREDWATAQAKLTTWAESAPEDAAPHLRLGKVNYKLLNGNKEGQNNAYVAYRKAYDLNKQVTRPEINMARLYEQDGKRSNAKQLLGKAVTRGGDDLRTQLESAQLYLAMDAIAEARNCADTARQIDSNSFDAMLLQGLVARYQKDYAAAESAFRDAHAMSPANVTVVLQLALCLVEQTDDQRRQSQALDWARLATGVNPDAKQPQGRESLAVLGWVLDRLGRTNEAGQAIQQAVSGGRLGAEATYFAAKILNDAGRSESAKQLLDRLINAKTPFPYRNDAENLLKRI